MSPSPSRARAVVVSDDENRSEDEVDELESGKVCGETEEKGGNKISIRSRAPGEESVAASEESGDGSDRENEDSADGEGQAHDSVGTYKHPWPKDLSKHRGTSSVPGLTASERSAVNVRGFRIVFKVYLKVSRRLSKIRVRCA